MILNNNRFRYFLWFSKIGENLASSASSHCSRTSHALAPRIYDFFYAFMFCHFLLFGFTSKLFCFVFYWHSYMWTILFCGVIWLGVNTKYFSVTNVSYEIHYLAKSLVFYFQLSSQTLEFLQVVSVHYDSQSVTTFCKTN